MNKGQYSFSVNDTRILAKKKNNNTVLTKKHVTIKYRTEDTILCILFCYFYFQKFDFHINK